MHGFSPDELNVHFAGVSVSPFEDIEDVASIFEEAGAGGFVFRSVGLGNVALVVKHLFSEACGKDGVPLSVISKALLIIGPHLVELISASFAQGVFQKLEEGQGFWLLKMYLFHVHHPISDQ